MRPHVSVLGMELFERYVKRTRDGELPES